MARKCPSCMTRIPAKRLLPHSSKLECPSCGNALEISPLSRNISVFLALFVAALVWKVTWAHYASQPGALGWVFPVLFSYLAYSIVAPLVLIPTGDLRLKPLEPAAEAPQLAAMHHGSAHGSHAPHGSHS